MASLAYNLELFCEAL